MSNILDILAHPDWSRPALASGAAGRSLPTTTTNVLAFGPARTVEAINQSPTPRRKVVDLLARHQPDRSRDQWRGVSARDEHERLVRHRCPRRSNIDPPCRSNIDPGMDAGRATADCG
jgi:hypothetical protein